MAARIGQYAASTEIDSKAPAAAGDEHASPPRHHAGHDRIRPERPRVVERERHDEADAGAAVDDGVEHVREHVDVAGDGGIRPQIGTPFLDRHRDVGRCALAHGCTMPST